MDEDKKQKNESKKAIMTFLQVLLKRALEAHLTFSE